MYVSSFAKQFASKKAIKVLEEALHYKSTFDHDPEIYRRIERYTSKMRYIYVDPLLIPSQI